MNEDVKLLARYAAQQSEAAFAELIRRHVDLVRSAALRLVNGDVHAAQDVTQQVFTELARQAKHLTRHPALVGWLYTTTRQMALHLNRTEQRRRAREQEASVMNELLAEDPSVDWNRVRPVIEEAMHELGEKDRHAILLRFFQNKPLCEVGAELNLKENAARMRVERALDKLRGNLARRGITTTATALGAVVSAHAVQVAPAGYAVSLYAAVIASNTPSASVLLASTTKTIVMTTLQKTFVAAALGLAVGTGIYAVHQHGQDRAQVRALQAQLALVPAQLAQLREERDAATNRLAALSEENERLKSGPNATELLKLRGQVGLLRQQNAVGTSQTGSGAGLAKLLSDPAMREFAKQSQLDKFRLLYSDLFKELKLTPEQTDKFLQLYGDEISRGMARYLSAGQGAPAESEQDSSGGMTNQLRTLLGDTGYARFESFTQEIPGRTAVNLLSSQLGDKQLSAEQSAGLMQIITAEPAALMKSLAGDPGPIFGSQADLDSFLQKADESNQRILQRAGTLLAPDQLASLSTILTNALNASRLQSTALMKH